jgi:hypothetical protein
MIEEENWDVGGEPVNKILTYSDIDFVRKDTINKYLDILLKNMRLKDDLLKRINDNVILNKFSMSKISKTFINQIIKLLSGINNESTLEAIDNTINICDQIKQCIVSLPEIIMCEKEKDIILEFYAIHYEEVKLLAIYIKEIDRINNFII